MARELIISSVQSVASSVRQSGGSAAGAANQGTQSSRTPGEFAGVLAGYPDGATLSDLSTRGMNGGFEGDEFVFTGTVANESRHEIVLLPREIRLLSEEGAVLARRTILTRRNEFELTISPGETRSVNGALRINDTLAVSTIDRFEYVCEHYHSF